MGSRCSLVATGNDKKDAGHETRRRLAALVAMIAIVLGAAIWSGPVFAQGSNQDRSDRGPGLLLGYCRGDKYDRGP